MSEPVIEDLKQRWKYIQREGIWRKGYKELLVLVGIGGTIFLWFYLEERSQAIQTIVLFLTGVTIFWYSRETYDLKRIQNKQIEEIRRERFDKFLPIVVPARDAGRLQSNGQLEVKLENVGRGIARKLKVKLDTVWITEGHSLRVGEPFELNIDDNKDYIIKNSLRPGNEEISMEVWCEDIYGRRVRTTGITMRRDHEGHFSLEPGSWLFNVDDTS